MTRQMEARPRAKRREPRATEVTAPGVPATPVGAMTDPAAIMQRAIDEAVRLTEGDGALIGLLADDGRLRFAYESGISESRVRRWRSTLESAGSNVSGMIGSAIAGQRVLATNDYQADTSFRHTPRGDRLTSDMGIRSLVAAPLVVDDRSIGALAVYATRTDAFAEKDVALVRALAEHAAGAIGNAALIERLARSESDLGRRVEAGQALSQVSVQLATLRDPAAVLQAAVDAAARLLRADGALIDLIDPVTGLIEWAYDAGIADDRHRDILRNLKLKVGDGMFGRAIAEQTVIVTDDYLADERFHHVAGTDSFAREAGIGAMIAAPLIGDHGPLGVLGIYTHRRHAYGDDEAALARSFATQATIAITNARLIDELERSRAEVARQADLERTLREIGARISALRDREDVVQRTVDEAVRLLGADGGRIDVVAPDSGLLRGIYTSGDEPTEDEWPATPGETVDQGVSGMAATTGKPFRTGDYLADERFRHLSGVDHYVRLKDINSVVAAPLMGDAAPFGAVTVWSHRHDAFSDRDETLLLALATQATVALTNARLIARLADSQAALTRQVDAEHALREIATRISAIHDPADVLQRTVDAAERLLGADGVILKLIDPNGPSTLRWAYDSGLRVRFDLSHVESLPLPVGVGLAGRAVAEQRVLIANDDPEVASPRTVATERFFAVTGFQSMMAAPVIGEAGPLGAIEVYSVRPRAFSEPDGELIQALAIQAAIAIANARLIEDLARSQSDLARSAETERTLREITARITAIRDPDEVLQRIIDEARRLLGSDGAHLTILAEDRTYLIPVVASAVDDETTAWMLGLKFPVHGGLNGLAATLGRAVRTDDYLVDPRIPHEPDDQYTAARLGLVACAVAPLRAPAGEIVGTLAISYRTRREIDDEAIELLQVLADQAAIAVTNSRLDALLRDSEARYRHLVENSPDLVWAIDADARFTFLSETCERLTGWRPDDLLGGHFGAIVHPISREVAEVDWTAGLADGMNEIRGRLNLLHRDGHAVPAEFIAVSVIEDGRFVGANGSVRDMTERDRLERELSASEARYRFLVENSPDVVFSIDADGRFTYISETIERITGRTPTEVTGAHFSTIVADHSKPLAADRWAALVADPATFRIVELDLLHRDGSLVPVEVSAIGVTNGDGAFAGIHGSTRDISVRRRLEGELRDSEERYRYLVKASPDVVWAVDEDGVITFVGDRIEELTGWTPDEIIGQGWASLSAAESLGASQEAWDAVRREPGGVYPLRIFMPHKTRDPIPVEIWVTGSVREGRFSGAHGSIRDMRDNERLQRDLRRQAVELAASDERAHLARELHDSVTQALFSMTLLTRSIEMLMARDVGAAQERLTTLRDLQRDALAEMRALIFELRPGGLEQDGLVPALRRHAAAVQGRIGLPVVVEAEIEDRLAAEVEDVLYRIAQEALHNVVKHAAAHAVRLTVARKADGIHLAVIDDGAGFETDEVPAGHLGLAGMRARAEKFGGRLDVTSRRGGGTTVEAIVPEAAIAHVS